MRAGAAGIMWERREGARTCSREHRPGYAVGRMGVGCLALERKRVCTCQNLQEKIW